MAVFVLCRKTMQKLMKLWLPLTLGLSFLLAVYISFSSAPGNLERTLIEQQKNLYGAQDAVFLNVENAPEKIESVSRIGYFTVFGIMELSEQDMPLTIALGTADDTAIALNHLRLREGHFPQRDDEIVMERWLTQELGLETSVGKKVTLQYKSLNQDGFNISMRKDFILSGILENYTNIQIQWVKYTRNPGFEQLPGVLFFDNPQDVYIKHATICLNGEEAENPAFNNFTLYDLGRNSFLADNDNIFINTRLGNFTEQTGLSDVTVFRTLDAFMGICAIILLILFLYIYAINSRKKTEILNRLGASRNQKFAYIFWQLLFISFISFLLSCGLSFAVYNGVVGAVYLTFDIVFKSDLSWLTFGNFALQFWVVSIIVSWEIALHVNRKKKTTNKYYGKKIFQGQSVSRMLLFKEIRNNLSRYISVALAIAISIAMINEAGSAWADVKNTQYLSCDICLKRESTMAMGALRIPVETSTGISSAQLDKIYQNPDVKDTVAVKEISLNFITEAGSNTYLDKYFATAKCYPQGPEEDKDISFSQELQQYGYTTDENIYSHVLLELQKQVLLNQLQKSEIIGEINEERLYNGQDIVVMVPEEAYKNEFKEFCGQSVHFSRIVIKDYETPNDFTRIDFQMRIAAVVIIPKENGLLTEALQPSPNFVAAEGTAAGAGLQQSYNSIFINLINPEESSDIEAALAQLLNNTGNMQIKSNTQLHAEQKKMNNFILAVSTGVMIPMLAIAFFIIILTHIYKLNERKEIYLRLRIMGMSKGALNRLLSLGYYTYMLIAYILFAAFTLLRYFTEDSFYRTINSAFILQNLIIITILIAIGGLFILYHKGWINRLEKE